jgi:hypothetical protein
MVDNPFIVLLLAIALFLAFFAVYTYFMYLFLKMASKYPSFFKKK